MAKAQKQNIFASVIQFVTKYAAYINPRTIAAATALFEAVKMFLAVIKEQDDARQAKGNFPTEASPYASERWEGQG